MTVTRTKSALAALPDMCFCPDFTSPISSRSSDLNSQGRPPLQGGEGDPKLLVSGVTENGSGSKRLDVV